MANAHCIVISFLTPPAVYTTRRKTRTAICNSLVVASSSSSSAPFQLNIGKRRNYLRPKILKTLTKPYPNITTTTPILPDESSETSIIPVKSDETPPETSVALPTEEYVVESHPATDGEIEKGLEVSETSINFGIGKFSTKSVMKFGLFFVGLFVIQTVVAVWVLGSSGSDFKIENLENGTENNDLELGKIKLVFKKNGNVNYMDELELEAKIAEIRAMAREARSKERNEKKNDDLISDFDDVIDIATLKAKSGIEKEVDARLVKLKNKLTSAQKAQGLNAANYFNKSEKVDEADIVSNKSLDVEQLNGSLFFEKKRGFRSQSTKPPKNDPKGFQGKENHSEMEKMKKTSLTNGSELFNQEKNLDSPAGALSKDVLCKDAGIVQDTNHGKHVSSRKESQNGFAGLDKHSMLSKNGSSLRREVGSKPVGNNERDKKSKTKTDLWWLKLPYVLAIVLRRNSDLEGPGGLYTLKTNPNASSRSDSAYTVTFEDRGDANNFCCLLDTFFQDLGDFTADIVPLPTKELQESVKKVIVVKRRQIQLYAGQPLADVERHFRSLIEE